MKVIATCLSMVAWALALPALQAPEKPVTPPEMTTYYLGLLVRGPAWTAERTPALEGLQAEHLAHLTAMAKSGKLIVAGPLTDDGRIRGILVFKVPSLQEAQSLAEADPAVKAGRLAVEIHPWMVQKGVLP